MAEKSIFITKSLQKSQKEQQQLYNADQETKQRGNEEESRTRQQHKIVTEEQMNSDLELSNAFHSQLSTSKHASKTLPSTFQSKGPSTFQSKVQNEQEPIRQQGTIDFTPWENADFQFRIFELYFPNQSAIHTFMAQQLMCQCFYTFSSSII